MITKWDTPADATEFAAAAGPTLKLLPSSTAMIDPGSTNQVVLFVASDQATINALAGALGPGRLDRELPAAAAARAHGLRPTVA